MPTKINPQQLKAVQGLYREIDTAMLLLQQHNKDLENWSGYEARHAIMELQAILMLVRSIEFRQRDKAFYSETPCQHEDANIQQHGVRQFRIVRDASNDQDVQ